MTDPFSPADQAVTPANGFVVGSPDTDSVPLRKPPHPVPLPRKAGGEEAGSAAARPESLNPERRLGSDIPVIEAIGIRKSYQIGGERCWVLDGVDFVTAERECVFLSGPSGSGKSTLLSIIGCLLTPDEGQVSILGRRVDTLGTRERTTVRRHRIGFVFQKFQLIRGLSALDNVAVPLTLQGKSLEAARDASAKLLKQVGLQSHACALPAAMSPGQCQRVAIARAVVSSPQLVLADEPTAALDKKSGDDVMNLLKELVASAGAAIIVVTHDPRIHRFADRVCVIESGRLLE